jgi:hypothetical protein
MNKNTGKAILSVIVTLASAITMVDQFVSGKKHEKEFEDMKKAVAELQKKN